MKRKIIFISALFFTLVISSSAYIINKKNTCANSITCINNLSTVIEYDTRGTFLGNTIAVPSINLVLDTPSPAVLGKEIEEENDLQEKHIYIDLSKQTLYAFEGSRKITETLISTGKWGRTPVGEYKIWIKIRSTKMSGGSGSNYYYLPNVPYVMYFYNNNIPKARGYGLHGTYWHNNFGNEMSHGCVNLRTTDAKLIYDWVSPPTIKSTTYASADNPGTSISICNKIQLQVEAKPLCLDTHHDVTLDDQEAALLKLSTTPTPRTATISQTSPEGTMTLILKTKEKSDNETDYALFMVAQDSTTQQLIFSETVNSETSIKIPFNTWSPDNKYFFIEKQSGNSQEYLIFKASGEKFENDPYVNVDDTYVQAETLFNLDKITGWGAPHLLIIKTKEKNTSAEGPSYWFDVSQQTFIRLSTRL